VIPRFVGLSPFTPPAAFICDAAETM